MATATDLAVASEGIESVGSSLVVRTRKVLSRAGGLFALSRDRAAAENGHPSATNQAESLELSFAARVRKFVWLSSGLFSAASLVMPALGILAWGSIDVDGIAANFLAGIASACLFGLTSVLHFGPDEA